MFTSRIIYEENGIIRRRCRGTSIEYLKSDLRKIWFSGGNIGMKCLSYQPLIISR